MNFSKTQFINTTNKHVDSIVGHYCDDCGGQLSLNISNEGDEIFPDLWTDEEMDVLFGSIFKGVTNVENLPKNVYGKIGSVLENGVFNGFGGTPLDFNIESPAFKMVESLRTSTWVFSGAKTANQILEIQSKLFHADGFKKSFSEFEKEARQVFDRHNRAWLQAEQQTAIAQSRSANQWLEIVDGGLELLQYVTIGDQRVRQEHKVLDRITKPTNDPFWDTFFPPNGWRCRCDVIELELGDAPTTETNDAELRKDVHPLFQMNAGKDEIVFSPKHDYFNLQGVNERFKVLARKNYGLPIPPPPTGPPIPIKAPIKRVKTPKKTTIKRELKKKVKTLEEMRPTELKKYVKDLFETKTPIQTGRMVISGKANKTGLVTQIRQIEKLLDEYDISTDRHFEHKTTIEFISRGRTDGVVEHRRRFGEKWRIQRASFGHREDWQLDGTASSDLSRLDRKYDKFGFNSRVNKRNINIATTTHEFAHFIAINGLSGDAKVFFEELSKIQRRYQSELRTLGATDPKKVFEIHLGKYANTDLDEFMAEAFTEYKLFDNPSKYAVEVGQLIDKHFKK
jgi:SPP1 gp7 family putative phage head morphogenesis protein